MSSLKGRLFVRVGNGRYDMYAAPSLRTRVLRNLLLAQGGVSDTVAPGWYEFRAIRKGLKIELSLTPQK